MLNTLFTPSRWGLVIVIKDLINYRKFINVIKTEESNPKSKYNLHKLKHNSFYTLYTMISLDDVDKALDARMKRFRVFEILKPVHDYIDSDLGFAGQITPEFSQFFDDKGAETLSYAAMYRYTFDKFSFAWLLKWIFILGVIALILIYSPIISWILNLM